MALGWIRRKRHTIALRNLPKHIAFAAVPEDLSELDVLVKNIQRAIHTCVRMRVPIVSFYILPKDKKRDLVRYHDYLCILMQELHRWKLLEEEHVRVSVLGSWYRLPSRCVEWIKKLMERTSAYDSTFVNLCVNYSGQEEILSAIKLLAKRIELGKLDAERIDIETVKENLQTSNHIPPDLIVVTGKRPRLDGFLLWDSVKSHIHFVEKPWHQFGLVDLVKGIRSYQKLKSDR